VDKKVDEDELCGAQVRRLINDERWVLHVCSIACRWRGKLLLLMMMMTMNDNDAVYMDKNADEDAIACLYR